MNISLKLKYKANLYPDLLYCELYYVLSDDYSKEI